MDAVEILTTIRRQEIAIKTASVILVSGAAARGAGDCLRETLLQPFFLPGKYFQCSLGKKPIFNNNGSPTCPLSDTGDGCDSDAATCVNLYTMGLCCNKTVEFGFAADQTATCLSGKSRYQLDGKSVLAKICDDLTCPNGYSCEQGNFFVSCCQD
uniref:BPTI/Kunitz inhibitor domain-containing protein n=1 Tax=Caenorhabditis japonica TaxID=281687 RepID=A0A8R1EHJ3_CAEJA